MVEDKTEDKTFNPKTNDKTFNPETDNTNNTYDPKTIELRWQRIWDALKAFKVDESKKQKFYCLEMYPYPSGKLHMGHLRNYSIGDCIARFKRLQGFNVLYPMGYDAFGLPAENAALTQGIHPKDWTLKNIESIKQQQKRLGFSYDWDRQIQSCDEDYYKWNQFFFLKMLKAGLAYRKKSFVNWCPNCNTVLANEQVIGGKCWRCHSVVQYKELEQWFLNTKKYAQELIEGLESLDWPEKVKTMQKNWIGRSVGTRVRFRVLETNDVLDVFTTRVDTLFGVTFLVMAPEHELARKWVKNTDIEAQYNKFLNKVLGEGFQERTSEGAEKIGFNLGKHAIHPLTKEKIPIYAANFVIAEYGSGVVMAVPAHDQRDFEFAKKYKLPIRVVVQPHDHELDPDKMVRAFEGYGVLVNSQEFSGLDSDTAIEEITKKLEELSLGGRAVEYKLKDWLISRQRYWGTPIPVVYCDKCGIVPVPEQELPVKLPMNVDFSKLGNPLTTNKDFINTKCPKCGGKALRETDTMDTFVDSSWYFLRYCSPKQRDSPFNNKKIDYWMPVDIYIGGIEHATMHLIYARFFAKALRDLGLLSEKFSEPFKKLVPQGMVTKPALFCQKCNAFLPMHKVDKDGDSFKCKVCGSVLEWRSTKMSKSLGNIVSPELLIENYGADAVRLAILATASIEKDLEWSNENVKHWFRFLNNLYTTIIATIDSNKWRTEENIHDEFLRELLDKAILKITKLLERLKIREAILELYSFARFFIEYCKQESKPRKQEFYNAIKKIAILLNPFTPHISEQIWSLSRGFNNMEAELKEGEFKKRKLKEHELKKEDLASLQEWPTTPKKLELTTWNHAQRLLGDINNVLRLATRKGVKPSKAFIIIASDKKRNAISKSIQNLKQGLRVVRYSKSGEAYSKKTNLGEINQKEINQIMQKLQKQIIESFKEQGLKTDIGVRAFKKLVKNSELLSIITTKDFLTQEAELYISKKIKQFLEIKTNLEIVVLKEEEVDEAIKSSKERTFKSIKETIFSREILDQLRTKSEQSMPAMPGVVLV